MSIAKRILEQKKVVEGKSAGAIKALIDAKPSDDNKDQAKFAELMKGLAFSDEPEATAFMKKLMGAIDQSFAGGKKVDEKKNIMAACTDLSCDSTDEEIEAVAKKSGFPAESIKKIAKGKKKMENDDNDDDDKEDDKDDKEELDAGKKKKK